MNKTTSFHFSDMEASVFGPPSNAGIYALCARVSDSLIGRQGAEHVLYIGSSANIKRRVLSQDHLYRRIFQRMDPSISVYTKHLLCSDYREVEVEAIQALRPWLNTHHNG